MTRNDKVLQYTDLNGYGLEIGPSHAPIAPKKAGYTVDIIDHMSRDQLLEKYQGHGVHLENIEEVDYVWKGESYVELTGKPKHYDWIIASHLIEHTPDLIGFLNDCDTILKDNGVISLVVPDKRYCFDHFRPITGLAKVIDSHFTSHKIHTPGTVAEYYLNVVAKAGDIGWHAGTGGDFSLIHTVQDALNGIQAVRQDHAYIDAHAWCFTPQSFRLMIHDLFTLGLIPFQEVDYHPTDGYEFYVSLSRTGQGISESRLSLLEKVAIDVKDMQPVQPANSVMAQVSLPRRALRKVKRMIKKIFS